MQIFKRASHNYALNFAIQMANERRLPLVVYEGLKFYYPWANDRIHTFILEGVAEKQAEFEERGIRYVFYVQRHGRDPKKTVARLAKEAALLVTDDFPCFIIPDHNERIAQLNLPVYAVDANGYGSTFSISERGVCRLHDPPENKPSTSRLAAHHRYATP